MFTSRSVSIIVISLTKDTNHHLRVNRFEITAILYEIMSWTGGIGSFPNRFLREHVGVKRVAENRSHKLS